MASMALVLRLWLGLCLSTGIQAAYMSGPAPKLWMEPNNIRPLGSEVTICCYTPFKADYFRLFIIYFNEWSAVGEEYPADPPGHGMRVYHPALRVEHGSRYQCIYRTGLLWSQPSPYLDLIISDVYPAPILTASAVVVEEGGQVDFIARVSVPVQIWMMIKGSVHMDNHVVEYRGQIFRHSIQNMKESDSGDYRCYAYNYNTLHIWTSSSMPVAVYVKRVATFSVGAYYGYNGTSADGRVLRSSPGVLLTSMVLPLMPLQSRWT